MSNVQLYTLAYVTIRGALLTEEASVTVNRSTGSQQVLTVAKGYAGESAGAAMVEIQVTNAVPAASFEYDAGKDMLALQAVEVGIIVAGRQLVARGFIISDSFKHSVNSESNYDFTFRGSMQLYETV